MQIPAEEAERAYFLGLNYLRAGLNTRSPFLVGGALRQFNRVVELAPEFAQGHFHAGLCLYYLENYRDAQFAFIEAVKLDDSLWEHCPLLWYEDFKEDWPLVETVRLGTEDPVLMENYLRVQPPIRPGLLGLSPRSPLFSPGRDVTNIHMGVSFRFNGTRGEVWRPNVNLNARLHGVGANQGICLQARVGANGLVEFRWRHGAIGSPEFRRLDGREVLISRNRWYRLTFDLLEGEYMVSLDGRPILQNVGDPNPALVMGGYGTLQTSTNGGNAVDIADFVVRRLHP